MSLQETYQSRKNLLAQNLTAMGVTASGSEGLTSLIDKVTDIAPSVGGITPTVSIDLSKNIANPIVGHDVVLSAKVNADYDDESQLDIDLHGYLQGASVLFKDGNTSLATTVSDNIGIATYTIQNIQAGSYSLTGFFDGTGTDYESATSNTLTFTVSVTPTLSLSSSSLTPGVGDTITLTASVVDTNNNPVADYPIQLYKDGTSMGSQYKSITNTQGVATITYTVVDSTSFVLNINGDTSTNTTITPISYIYFDDCSTDKSSNITGSITYRSGNQPLNISYVTGQYYTLSQTSSNICGSNRELVPPQGLTEIKIEYDMYLDSQYGYGGFLIYKDSNNAINWNYTNNTIFQGKMNNGTYNESSTSQSGWSYKWLHIVMVITNNTMVMSVYNGDTQVYTTTENISSTIWDNIHYAFLNCVNGTFNVKNIIVTLL